MDQRKRGRRQLVPGMGAAAAAVALAGTRTGAQAAPPATAFQPLRHDKDAWFDKVPGKHRMVLDVTTAAGVGEALGFASNLFAGNKSGYNLDDGDLAMVICLRHFATVFAFTDPVWAKHGKAMSDMVKYTSRSGEPPCRTKLRGMRKQFETQGTYLLTLLSSRIYGIVSEYQ